MPDPAEGASDEAADPHLLLQQQAEEMQRELIRTIELGPKLEWNEFDFEIDLFDPTLDDLEGVLSQGQRPDQEIISLICTAGLNRHFSPKIRLRLIHELSSRLAGEVRLDVREQARTLMKALHHLSIPGPNIGLLLHLYPKNLFKRLQERHKAYQAEEREITAEQHQVADALQSGQVDGAAVAALGNRFFTVAERVLFASAEPASLPSPAAIAIAREGAKRPSLRAARLLTALFWKSPAPDALAEIRKGLTAMPVEARDVLDHHLLMHDPDPATRLAIFGAMIDLGHRGAVARMAEDALGHGPWTKKSKDAEHAKSVVAEIVRLGDSRAIPMVLYILSVQPPPKGVKEAVVEGMRTAPWAGEFNRAYAAQEEGIPVVIPRGVSQTEFLQSYADVKPKMKPAEMQAEIRRVAQLWEKCYHEDLGWRMPQQALDEVGPREKELLGRLAQETRKSLGHLSGRPQVAALESEFKSRWMTTPQNDISGRIPLAIILDERAARDPESARNARETEVAQLYEMACRAHEAKIEDDAQRILKGILQLEPAHPLAKEMLDRLERGDGVPGLDEGAEGPATPRIIIPT